MFRVLKKSATLLIVFIMIFSISQGKMDWVPNKAFALGTIYYVDPAGNDVNSGTSTGSAWKTLTKVNSVTFVAGDSILFKSGGTWNGQLYPKGSGTSSNKITIDKYGSGNSPIINGSGADAGIKLYNQQYWTIKNLQVKNTSSTYTMKSGILVMGNSYGGVINGITITNCDVNSVDGVNDRTATPNFYHNAGIMFLAIDTAANTRFNGITVDNNYIHDLRVMGIHLMSVDKIDDGTPGNNLYKDNPVKWNTNVVISNNVILKTGQDGIIVGFSDAPLINSNTSLYAGFNGDPVKSSNLAGIWGYSSRNLVFQYNEAAYTQFILGDGEGWDCDWGIWGNCTYQYNYSHDNEGGTLLNWGPGSNLTNVVFRYNVAQNDVNSRIITMNGKLLAYNNTLYNNQASQAQIIDKNDPGDTTAGAQFYNNIFMSNTGSGTFPSDAIYDYNAFIGFSSYPTDTHKVITSTAIFVNPGKGGDYRSGVGGYKITSGAAVKNAGKTIANNGGKDYYGNTLYQGSPDIGAHEFVESHLFSNEVSSTQGQNNWYYKEYTGSSYNNLVYDFGQSRWEGTYAYNLIGPSVNLHPDTYDTLLIWKSTVTRKITVSGRLKKADTSGGDGVRAIILKNNIQIWPNPSSGWYQLAYNDAVGVDPIIDIDVAPNDEIKFLLNKNSNISSDSTYWNPLITY
ncbi:hypothetical protein EHS13_09485 [Paenibacillus psychroresistens]|uniref:Right-handed parallel beta-helix repeat-containing protein n=1 Tax=Paenibacillus psychroresistens TaxID=1778678 RepID=A0A6B8RG62_9BACL|nr:hypothetical protein [Paenibacillus psychroresistens]QGQ95099.1 hypothetical protein EHS13_09485 [Paenibacillus psychroresistens]